MIDFLLILMIGVVAWCVASEGPWGAALTFLSVLFSGLIAMNWFEPLAGALDGIVGPTRSDIIALLGLFAGAVFLFRFATEYLMPTYVEVHGLVYNVFRWSLGVATGYTTMAILLTALHVAPLPREFIGFRPERKNLFDFSAPDRQWLALTQYVSENSLQKPYGPRFDAPSFERIPGDKDTMQTWSSFPIRYAYRRELLASGGFAPTAGSAPPTNAPPPTQAPQGGGGQPNF